MEEKNLRTREFTVRENKCLAQGVFRMILEGDVRGVARAGQFVDVRLDGLFLRRPISVCDWDGSSFTLIYKTVGKGTEQMARLPVGARLNVLIGLGNGFDLSLAGARPVLIGGGVGVPPLYGLAKELGKDRAVDVILGFNRREEIFYEEEFRALGCRVTVTTVDGSYGVKGFVTDALQSDYTHFYACGPLPMLRAVCGQTTCGGSLSMEERMGCGFGACMGCSIQTKNGVKRVCKEGPVFSKEEILW